MEEFGPSRKGMLTAGESCDLVSKKLHDTPYEKGFCGWGLGTRGLRTVATFGPAYHIVSAALDLRGSTGGRRSPILYVDCRWAAIEIIG